MNAVVLPIYSGAPLGNDPYFNNDFSECLIVANTTLNIDIYIVAVAVGVVVSFCRYQW